MNSAHKLTHSNLLENHMKWKNTKKCHVKINNKWNFVNKSHVNCNKLRRKQKQKTRMTNKLHKTRMGQIHYFPFGGLTHSFPYSGIVKFIPVLLHILCVHGMEKCVTHSIGKDTLISTLIEIPFKSQIMDR